MAYSYVHHTGDGSTRIFSVPFPFLSRSYIRVSVNQNPVDMASVEWLSDASLRLPEAPAAGDVITITRTTDRLHPVTDFRNGSTLTEEDLDNQTAQLLHIAQEVYDVPEGMQETADRITEVLTTTLETAHANTEEQVGRATAEADRAYNEADRAKAEADRAQSLVEVGPATAEHLGMVKIGSGVEVAEDGTISTEKITTGATLQTDEHGLLNVGPHAFENPEICGKGDFQNYGHVRVTDNPDENAGAVAGMAASPAALRTAVARILDVSEDVTITTSGTYAVPFTGAYSITAVGGGGNGGNDSGSPYGGRGGGGGAGQVSTISRHLTKGQKIPIVIGGSGGGQTSVGDFLTAAGGGNGGDGQPGNYNPWHGTGNMGAPGAAGFSYGTPASPGGHSGTAATGGTSAFPPYGNGGNGGTLISAPSNVLPPTPGTSGCVRITLTKLGG